MATYEEIAGMIDHALLKPFATDQEIVEGCKMAHDYGVAAVCVRPSDVALAKEILKDSKVLVTTVIGFPHGTTTTRTKVNEAKEAMENGAVELDVVLHIGKLKSGAYHYVKQDLKEVIDLAHEGHVPVKVIFENCYLTAEEKIAACTICTELGADFAKTSTGFGTGGAEIADVKLMREHLDPKIQVKAAGGVRTLEQAIALKEAGCTRLGCTATGEILGRLRKSAKE
ncbi:deoxyribose-phosphate aldolase [Candidatus Formimonas warabiya]|uniref:Deoxyribose-phosphate aldolase n=1 Tax=Formimonas warabiya TaxID=1761012 RepID=A0A3G1L160_FORW1|nr:deoxyribose-phosphate aldolase [Candidatus Formimonas warabiya]ATW28391.1 deoxyribose-phosphate aldolase [Candidatus Formimonas warabiya]